MYEHKTGNLVACICEGKAEIEIIEILLRNDKLKFTQDDLLDEKLFTNSMRSSKNLERRYLTQNFEEGQQIEIIRILDSRKENFKISEEYRNKVAGEVTNCYTRPEIEMLIILREGHYENYKRSSYQKPSEYCIHELKLGKNIKKRGFISNYFAEHVTLIEVLEEYHRIRPDKGEDSIYTLLR